MINRHLNRAYIMIVPLTFETKIVGKLKSRFVHKRTTKFYYAPHRPRRHLFLFLLNILTTAFFLTRAELVHASHVCFPTEKLCAIVNSRGPRGCAHHFDLVSFWSSPLRVFIFSLGLWQRYLFVRVLVENYSQDLYLV